MIRKIKDNWLFLLLSLSTAIFLSVFFILGKLSGNAGIDSDILWHYKLGEEIIKTHAINISNNFTWQSGTTWIQYEWLYDVILYGIIKIADSAGYIWLFTINKWLLLVFAAKHNHKSNSSIYLVMAFLLLLLFPSNTANRPSEFSLWIMIAVILLYNNTKIKNWHKIIIMGLLGVLTVNFHGGAILIITAIMGVLIGLDIIVDIREKELKTNIKTRLLSIVSLVVMELATIVNPSGTQVWSVIFKVSNYETTEYIQEWQPTEFTWALGLLFMLMAVAIGYNLKKNGFSHENVRVTGILSAFAILSMMSCRGCMIYAMMFLVFGYEYLDDMLRDFFKRDFKLNTKFKQTMLPALAAFIICLGFINASEVGDFSTSVNNEISMNVMNYITDNINGSRILHSYNYGNWMMWNDAKCFIDSRQTPYCKENGNTSLDDLLNIDATHDKEKLQEFLDKYKFEYIVCNEQFDINWYLKDSDKFELVVEDKDKDEYLWKVIDNN